MSTECLPYMSQSLSQSYLRCCLRCLWLMETLVCSVCGMPTIHVPITVPELSEMLLTLLMVNGNTSLRRLRYVYGTCPELSGALTVILLYCLLLNTVQWLFDFKQFDWFGGHRLTARILLNDYIWKTPGNSIYFQTNICR